MSLDSLNTYNNRSSQSSSTGSSSGNEIALQSADPISNLFHNFVGTIFPSASQSTLSSSSISAVTDSSESGEEARMVVDIDSMETYHSDDEQKIDNRNRAKRGLKRKHSASTGVRKKQKSEQCPQYKINYICSCMQNLEIKNRVDLFYNLKKLTSLINNNPKIFKSSYTEEDCFEIFKQALTAYNRINDCTIAFSDGDVGKHRFKAANPSAPLPQDELSRMTRSYDRLVKSHNVKKSIHEGISEILKKQPYSVCSHLVLGAGDTGIEVWLQKYQALHGKTEEKLANGQLPEVLIIAEDHGCWSHDYTLAQPHSFLERKDVKWNPSDYVTEKNYNKNAFVNGRHVYQANQVILAKTEAPLLTATMKRIERQEEHSSDWQEKGHEYRMIISTPGGDKTIYNHEVDICTGLGAPRKISNTILPKAEFDRLNQFDNIKKFTPIIDGNQFMLTDSEEHCPDSRSIVVYGGGGTASACFRKAFFGQDKGTQDLEFTEPNRKNSVKWVARMLDTVGNGRLASRSVTASTSRNEFQTGDLQKITQDPTTGKLKLLFKKMDPGAVPATFEIECDQLIFSIGQDDIALKNACKEFQDEMRTDYDVVSGVPIGAQTTDGKIHAYGAASMAIGRTRNYIESTTDLLKKENIGPDVGVGTMAPSRAQIKQYASKKFKKSIASVNVNSDSKNVMEKFLGNAGIGFLTTYHFLEDVMEARKKVGFDLNPTVLQQLLDKHSINGFVQITGHGYLIKR